MCIFFAKRFAGFEKVTTFASAIEKTTGQGPTKVGAEASENRGCEKKVLKNLVVKKKGFTFVPTFASEKCGDFFSASPKGEVPKKVL